MPGHSARQPSLGFGIVAVSKSTQDNASSYDKAQEVQAFFQVDTELAAYTEIDTVAPNIMMGTTQEPPVKMLSNNKVLHPECSLSGQSCYVVLKKPTPEFRNAINGTAPGVAASEEEPARITRAVTVPFLPKSVSVSSESPESQL